VESEAQRRWRVAREPMGGTMVLLFSIILASSVAAQTPHKTTITGFQQYVLGADMRQVLRL
jgi:hypothetical protein